MTITENPAWGTSAPLPRRRHRWWHLRSVYAAVNGLLVSWCPTCGEHLGTVDDDGYRCPVCGSAFCDPMEHH